MPACGTPRRLGPGAGVERAAEAMADCFGAPVSTGWLASLSPTAADRLEGLTTAAREQLQAATVAHFDETGGRVAGKPARIHVAATDTLTLYQLATGRGKASMDAVGVLPEFTGVAVHDGLTSYRRLRRRPRVMRGTSSA